MEKSNEQNSVTLADNLKKTIIKMSIQTKESSSESQVVSRQRVVDHGEVYTAQREVMAMVDLVNHEAERVDARFLEPACGTGNFLVEVLERKLKAVFQKYSKDKFDLEQYTLLAVSSIYGIDLLFDNVERCRKRLLDLTTGLSDEGKKAAAHILSKNIVCGDALSLKGIVFTEWSPVGAGKVKRRDFAFHELVAQASITELPLFSDLGEEVFIPEAIKEYPVISFLKICDA
jgi:hypothetical protein